MDELAEWKNRYGISYAVLIEGARRVGKSTVAEEFAKNNFRSYIKIDFSNITKEMENIFDDISNLDVFFLRLQAFTRVTLYIHESVIIFDEIQLAPKVRQAIKHLVKDGRYYYIETGSLISIKKNIQNIVIPSEEHRIQMYPMDYEEFLWATGNNSYDILRNLYALNRPVGNAVNNKLMRDFRIYMAVGGMPQAIEAYVNGKNFEEIDRVKREIIELYKSDLRKISPSGSLSLLYDAIPAQLAMHKNRFVLSTALGKRTTEGHYALLAELLDSKTVNICYNVADPSITLSASKDLTQFKLYPSDIGLFTTMIFKNEKETSNNIYSKLLSDKLEANLGYMYESVVAQLIRSSGRDLYYHTWSKANSTRNYEIDFLISSGTKIIPIEVKSSNINNHDSINAFFEKYSKIIANQYILSQKDVGHSGQLMFKPIYMLPFILG